MTLSMQITEIFQLGDGRTVLVGHVESGRDFIRRTKCRLTVDGRAVQTIELEGEMLPEKRTPDPRRSVSTFDAVRVTDADVKARDVRLLCP
jgi:hypothetical protein